MCAQEAVSKSCECRRYMVHDGSLHVHRLLDMAMKQLAFQQQVHALDHGACILVRGLQAQSLQRALHTHVACLCEAQ